ncbi:MAG: hypothetical protein ACYDGN_14440 [Acidimicrobiales bacterium]
MGRWDGMFTRGRRHLQRVAERRLPAGLAIAVLDAGATKAAHQPAPEGSRVMIDPASHPCCLATQIPD